MSSFRKRNIQKPIPGTRTSSHTGQVITSSGNPSLDVLLGGGLPVGSICLIEEDKYVTYAKVLAKYFLAEGVISKQAIFLGSLDDEPTDLLSKLPQPITDGGVEKDNDLKDDIVDVVPAVAQSPDSSTQPKPTSNQNGLRIAWRYEDLPLVNSEQTNAKIGHHFNLLEKMDPKLLYYAKTTTWNDALNQPDIVIEDEDIVDDHFTIKGQLGTSGADSSASTSSLNEPSLDDVKMDISMYAGDEQTTDQLADQPADQPADQHQQQQQQEQEQQPKQEQKQEQMDQPLLVNNNEELANNNSNSNATAAPTTPPFNNNILQAAHLLMQSSLPVFDNKRFQRLLYELQPLLQEEKFIYKGVMRKDVCRVCLTSLGSPLWYDDNFAQDILKFLTVLRATIRTCSSVCFITMPMHLISKLDATLVPRIRNLVDYAFELESFGSEQKTNAAYKEYNGLFHIRKVSAFNTLTAYMPETTDLAFKLLRRKFVIETLHLPPELQETNEDVTMQPPRPSCSNSTAINVNITNAANAAAAAATATLDF